MAPTILLREPLLNTTGQHNVALYQSFHTSTLILGFMVGVIIQLSTMGANFLIMTVYGDDAISSTKDIIIFSLIWSTVTSTMAFFILGFIRNLLKAGYRNMTSANGDEEAGISEELDDIILNVECRFVVGAMMGVCLSWTVTDIFLGLNVQVMYSLITLTIALFWCHMMLRCFSSGKTTTYLTKSIDDIQVV